METVAGPLVFADDLHFGHDNDATRAVGGRY
ncbi:hypothetical protein MAXJ12_18993 [Mesorhizobium alhagi CCNWXJ12-2]|uniref:Uncharacterized protein n=1 Tax=Mesorhizobium alhagi CCNWXJ12-2 TaxID=1107882 RepID=H0HUF7_9HYPH|nr:hypothetical protein MAXJ12_18993 [Mesorhizobium alhagi CCNWXJ12-2]